MWRSRAVLAVIAALASACHGAGAGGDVATSSDEVTAGEPARVPDPAPRYGKADGAHDDGAGDDGVSTGAPLLKCGSPKPFVCVLDDGTAVCSEVPCVPPCDRVGCVGGDVCTACDGGFRCVPVGEGC